jgi:hypothetical protein
MKTITLSGYIWIHHSPQSIATANLLLGNVRRADAKDTPGSMSKTLTLPYGLKSKASLIVDAHVIVTASYEERVGMTPLLTIIAIEEFDPARETDEWKDYY